MTAWAITVKDWPEIDAVCDAETRGKAHALAFNAAKEAGYRVKWSDIRVRREVCFAPWAGCLFGGNRLVSREYLSKAVFGRNPPNSPNNQLDAKGR